MPKLIYRGVPVIKADAPSQTLAEQMKRPELFYRGVAHDGERPVAQPSKSKDDLVYRGARFA